jgi:protein TonB
MRRDLIIGILISAFFHGAFLFAGKFMKPAQQAQVIEEETPVIEVLVPPPIEPDEAEPIDFTQAVQPPPPPNLGRPTGVMNIPAGRPGTGAIGTKIGDIFNLKDLDQHPQDRGVKARPNYPFEMRRAGLNGEVVLRFVVDTNGDVRDVEVIRSSQREFEAAAIQAVQRWKYRPGRKGGKAVATRMQIPIVFNLNDE